MEHKAWEDAQQLNSPFIDCVFLPRLKKKVSEFTVPELTVVKIRFYLVHVGLFFVWVA